MVLNITFSGSMSPRPQSHESNIFYTAPLLPVSLPYSPFLMPSPTIIALPGLHLLLSHSSLPSSNSSDKTINLTTAIFPLMLCLFSGTQRKLGKHRQQLWLSYFKWHNRNGETNLLCDKLGNSKQVTSPQCRPLLLLYFSSPFTLAAS